MIHSLLADLVLVLHLGFIGFVSLGALLGLRWPRILWLHAPALAWGLAAETGGWVCPLTPLEVALRRAAGEAGYAGGFVAQYLVPLIYPPGLERSHQWVLAALLAAVNLGAYGLVWWRRRR